MIQCNTYKPALITLDGAISDFDQAAKQFIIELLKKYDLNQAIMDDQVQIKNILTTLKKAKVSVPDEFFRDLAKNLGMQYIEKDEAKNLVSIHKKEALASALPMDIALKYQVIPLDTCNSKAILATSNPLDKECLSMCQYQYGALKNKMFVVSFKTADWVIDYLFKGEKKRDAEVKLSKTNSIQSAHRVLFLRQKIAIIAAALAMALALFLSPMYSFVFLFSAISVLYFVINPIKIYISFRGFKGPRTRAKVTEGELLWVPDEDLPAYTILVPLYHEANMLNQIMKNIYSFNYPKEKMDVKILMEDGDKETIAEANRIGLFGIPKKCMDDVQKSGYSSFLKIFDPIIVPKGKLTTKPRACNYGLSQAIGELCVIYDAEDNPDPDQLKKAAVVFLRYDENLVCLQSKLNFYNKNENLLTRWFSVEYSYWYEFYLSGLDWVDAPIPLGGTSNHFRLGKLEELGKWDPYNVTEDADLGVRISRKKLKTQIIESRTFEEATNSVKAWIKQRSRWYKGHLQTYLVHMRYPKQLFKDLGFKKFLKFQFTFGASIFIPIINPILWAVMALTLAMPALLNVAIPGYIQAICMFNLVVGNISYIAMYVLAGLKLRDYRAALVSLTMPLYWVLISVAGWRGLIQLIKKPFYWDKTTHGISSPSKI